MDDETVVVHYDERGEVRYLVNGEAVRLFIVDDRAPDDRVYEVLTRNQEYEIDELIPDNATIEDFTT